MNVCRICLKENVYKDAHQLQRVVKDKGVSHTDVMFFCLNIQITNNSKASKLCLKCYKKIIAFYKFKLLAIENDKYFQSLENNGECEMFVPIKDIKEETEQINDPQEGQMHFEQAEEIPIQIKDEPEKINQEVDGNPEIKEEHEWIDGYTETDGECHNTKPKVKKIVKNPKEKLTEEAVAVKRKRGHKKTEDGEKLKICEECGKAVRDIEAHMEVHKPSSERKTIPCKKCDKVFLTYAARYLHNKYKHEGVKEICTICNKSVSIIKSHMKAMHQPDELKYPCQSCNKRFLTPAKLEQHTRQHTHDRPFECDVCHGMFSSKAGLSLHIRSVHKKERLQHCQICSKSFFKKYHLQIHLRTHTKEKPHKCEECNKSFMTAHCLKIHHKRHAGIKDVPCMSCDRKFINVREMKTHLVTHTKEKKHACQYCGVKFYRSDHRLKHERTAHLKKMQTSTVKV